MRKGRTTLLSAKVMLFALLNVENRNEKQYSIKDAQYYKKLSLDSGVDYSKGIVSEIAVADLRKLLKKEKSGSIYASLRELFSGDPHEPRSLRNGWAVMLPNTNSGILGYAEVITACHYDTSSGRLFIKFSEEHGVKDQIFKGKEKCTELPFLHMLSIKSIHAYRLYEILWSQVTAADAALRESGDFSYHSEYSFRFSLGELQLMLGIVDLTLDREAKKLASASKEPDYNLIADLCNQTQAENMHEYSSFRRYSITVAMNEINNSATSAFTIDYDVERDGNKVVAIVFYVKKKQSHVSEIASEKKPQMSNADFIIDLARELSSMTLTYDELTRIAMAADYDKELVIAALIMYEKLNVKDNFCDWFIDLRK
jgi:plasmid replication initiation protein